MTAASTSTIESFTIVCGPSCSQAEVTIAVGLYNDSENRLFMRFRDDLQEVISESEIDVIGATEEHFLAVIAELGASGAMAWMQDTLSNFVRFCGPEMLDCPRDFEAALNELYEKEIRSKSRSASEN